MLPPREERLRLRRIEIPVSIYRLAAKRLIILLLEDNYRLRHGFRTRRGSILVALLDLWLERRHERQNMLERKPPSRYMDQ